MPKFVETCSLGLTDKEIEFSIDDDREPSPTNPCICGGTPAENNAHGLAALQTTINLTAALGDSIAQGGKPVEYTAFEVKGERHSSEITRVG